MTDTILVKQFQDLNITVHGTYEEPLFKAKDVGELLDIRNVNDAIKHFDGTEKSGVVITDPHGRHQITNMLTEQGLYKLLFSSRKPIAKVFQKWVCDVIKEIRLKGKYDLQEKLKEKEQQLQQKEQELIQYKQKTYEEIDKTGHIYVIQTDAVGAYKVGKTKDAVTKRVKGLQTGNVNSIAVLLDFPTSNPDLLERVVHYILDRYRCNSNREFFDCNIEYIKSIVTICGHTIDTLKSTYQSITSEEIYSHLNVPPHLDLKLEVPHVVEESQLPYEQHKQERNDKLMNLHNWLDKNVIFSKGKLLQVRDVHQLYLGVTTMHTHESTVFRRKIEEWFQKFHVSWEYSTVKIGDKACKGWKDFCVRGH